MKAIAEHIFEGGNDKFDEKQYWTYGCHCFFLGDRPLSDMGKGTPVDQLRVPKFFLVITLNNSNATGGSVIR